MPDELHIYAVSLLCMSVCVPADMDTEEIERRANRQNMCGLAGGWRISKDRSFRTGEPMPGPCDEHPATRQHWLLEC